MGKLIGGYILLTLAILVISEFILYLVLPNF